MTSADGNASVAVELCGGALVEVVLAVVVDVVVVNVSDAEE